MSAYRPPLPVDLEFAAPSRRTLLAGALGGVAALAASTIGGMARPSARGAVGDPLLAGMSTAAGGATTTLTNSSDTKGTLLVKQNGKGTALRGQADKGTGGRFSTKARNKFGLVASNTAANPGIGAAIQATATANPAILADTAAADGVALLAANSSSTGVPETEGSGIRALSGAGTVDLLHPGGTGFDAAGEFAGPIGVLGVAAAEYGAGVEGRAAQNGTPGVRGVSSGSTFAGQYAAGVSASASGVAAPGLLGHATGLSGHGVLALSEGTDGCGVVAEAAGSGETVGVYGESTSTQGIGVRGVASGGSGSTAGVWGETYSSTGSGVRGYAPDASGICYGVFGESASDEGRGVYGYASSATGTTYGVVGTANSAGGYAIQSNGRMGLTSYLEISEIALPGSPPADKARLFVRDNGSGKTQLAVRFSSGTVFVLATDV